MSQEFEKETPEINHIIERWANFGTGAEAADLKARAISVVNCAGKIESSVRKLEEKDINGFMLALTKRDLNYPTLLVQIGKINEPDSDNGPHWQLAKYSILANLQALVLKNNHNFISSSQNLSLPDDQALITNGEEKVSGGALAFDGDWIISVAGLTKPELNTAAVLGIAIGAKFVSQDEAEIMAEENKNVNCKLFMENEDIFTVPVLG